MSPAIGSRKDAPVKVEQKQRLQTVHLKISGEGEFVRLEVPGVTPFVTCPECQVRVKNMPAHRRKVHPAIGGAVTEESAGGKQSAPKVKFSLVKCAVCGRMVKNLAKHVALTLHRQPQIRAIADSLEARESALFPQPPTKEELKAYYESIGATCSDTHNFDELMERLGAGDGRKTAPGNKATTKKAVRVR